MVIASIYDTISASAVRAAEPIEALAGNRGGVAERVESVGTAANLSSSPAIWAMPPALSATGP